MSNQEIILSESLKKNFIYTGDNLHTYPEWMSLGYSVKRGQKAYIKVRIWSLGINKRKIPANFFTLDQVLKIS